MIGWVPLTDHVRPLQPGSSVRYYLLDNLGETLPIEVHSTGRDDRTVYDEVVRTFRFG